MELIQSFLSIEIDADRVLLALHPSLPLTIPALSLSLSPFKVLEKAAREEAAAAAAPAVDPAFDERIAARSGEVCGNDILTGK